MTTQDQVNRLLDDARAAADTLYAGRCELQISIYGTSGAQAMRAWAESHRLAVHERHLQNETLGYRWLTIYVHGTGWTFSAHLDEKLPLVQIDEDAA